MKEVRQSSRYNASVKLLCSADRQEGPAELTNLSSGGALLTGLQWTPAPGSVCHIVLQAAPGSVLTGRVVRAVEDGFAVEFEDLNPSAKSLLDDLARMGTCPTN